MQKIPYIRLDLWDSTKVSEELSLPFVLPEFRGCGDKGGAAHPLLSSPDRPILLS